jgi:hypothetical protein
MAAPIIEILIGFPRKFVGGSNLWPRPSSARTASITLQWEFAERDIHMNITACRTRRAAPPGAAQIDQTKGPVLPPGLSLFLSAECWT